MPTLRLTLEYDGRDFAGWQVQAGGQRTVQGTLCEALLRVTGQTVKVVGAGRTDAGVHAEAQVASIRSEASLEPAALQRALNGVLPADVSVTACEAAPDGFHARYDALFKRYRYRIWNGASRSPLRAARFHWVRTPLDLPAMREAAAVLTGTHDFASFQAAGSDVVSTVRTLTRLDVVGEAGGMVDLIAEADGFLRHMVRILAGTLIEVGLGRRDAAGVPALLAGRERSRAGRTAPSRALTLIEVRY